MPQPKHLAAGRKRYEQQRKRDAIARVRAYEKWLRNGCNKNVPPIPSNNDYKVARDAGAVKR